ncbi:MAG: hypothetical protein ABIR71_10555 [Chthoniobacterales bacterium]
MRLIVGSIVGLVVFVLVIWAGSRFYYSWQERHVLRRAAAYLSGGDTRAAGLSARRAYQLNQNSVPAARMLGEIAETAGERTALEWRRKAVQLNPKSMEDQIALAKSAVQFDDLGTAERAVAVVTEPARTPVYHEVRARLAEARQEPAQAREHWMKAVQMEPANKSYQMKLAGISLALPDPAVRESARVKLEELRQDPEERVAATRALILDGVTNRKNSEDVIALARKLREFSEASFSDSLLYLDILRQMRHPSFVSVLTEVEKTAQERPNDLANLLSWMNKSSLSALALNYSRELKLETLAQWPVPLALAESYTNLADWSGLEGWTKMHSWGSLEFLRRAYLARALREQDKTVAAEREWNAARKEAGNQGRMISLLTRTVIEWRWTDEAVDLLWTLAKDPAEKDQALRSLYKHYAETGDTAGLYRTLLRLVEAMPEDLSLQNNLAQTGLLLNADPERARKIAADLRQKDPTQPAYISTYAFSLFSKGDAAGAVQAMAGLKEEQLREPALAAYYGVFLAGAGQPEKAREYLRLGSEAKLLPEEKALLTKAESKLE